MVRMKSIPLENATQMLTQFLSCSHKCQGAGVVSYTGFKEQIYNFHMSRTGCFKQRPVPGIESTGAGLQQDVNNFCMAPALLVLSSQVLVTSRGYRNMTG